MELHDNKLNLTDKTNILWNDGKFTINAQNCKLFQLF